MYNSSTKYLLLLIFVCLYHNCTLNSFLLHFTANFIRCNKVTMRIIRISHTTPAAIKFSPAILTYRFVVNIALFKIFSYIGLFNTIINCAHFKLFHANKLMTRIKITCWGNSKILCAGTAAYKPLCNTRN